MTDDGHYIDDPLVVVNAKPDFSGMGLHPIHPNGRPMTWEKIIGDIPDWIKLLPKDWEGETIRSLIEFTISKYAINNKRFDLTRYVSAKVLNSLRLIMRKHKIKEIHLTQNFRMTVDGTTNADIAFFLIHIEFAK